MLYIAQYININHLRINRCVTCKTTSKSLTVDAKTLGFTLKTRNHQRRVGKINLDIRKENIEL